MRKAFLFVGIFVTLLGWANAQTKVDALLNELDRIIADRPTYIEVKEDKIQGIRQKLKAAQISASETYLINNDLFQEYKVYRFDSALHYVYANLQLSEAAQNSTWIEETKLNLSSILTSTGMYKESIENLKSIDTETLHNSLMERYYVESKLVYEGLHQYALDNKFGPKYLVKAKAYQDSLLSILDPGSNDYLLEKGLIYLQEGDLQKAQETYQDLCFNRLEPATSIYAKATATLASIYAEKGEKDLQKRYLIESAMTDIQAVVKENLSLTSLAVELYQEEEIERANRYIEYALADANFYNARQRKVEISKIYPIINDAYQLKEKKQKDTLRFYLGFITAISVLLIVALVAIYFQMQKLSRARQNLHELNQALQQVNHRLNESNQKLNESNEKLKEANFIKEEYIGHFLNQCSVYIDKLESYQKVVRKKVMTKELNALIKMTESKSFLESELKEFYSNFDRAFLRLYPNFVEEFNSLLGDGQQILPKKGELLTTELRIFALIRLGISDSYKIAHFLRYSVNTIYNYRAQIKNKSTVERDHFENHVMSIGAFYNDN